MNAAQPRRRRRLKVSRNLQQVSRQGLDVIKRRLDAGPAQDEYGDMPRVKRQARAKAAELGHDLTQWKRKPYAPNTPNTAASAYCRRCMLFAMIDLQDRTPATGHVLTDPCKGGR